MCYRQQDRFGFQDRRDNVRGVYRCAPLAMALVLLLSPYTPAVAAHWAESWEAIESAVAGLSGIQADFVQTKELSFLTAPLESRGKLYFSRPDALRWEYLQPMPSVLIMLGQSIHRYQRVEGEWQPDQSARLAGMQVVMQEIGRWLQGDFRSNPDFNATLGPGPEITLMPKDETLQALISKIRLTLAQDAGVIDAVIIEEGTTGRTTIRFEKAQINPVFDERLFSDPERHQ